MKTPIYVLKCLGFLNSDQVFPKEVQQILFQLWEVNEFKYANYTEQCLAPSIHLIHVRHYYLLSICYSWCPMLSTLRANFLSQYALIFNRHFHLIHLHNTVAFNIPILRLKSWGLDKSNKLFKLTQYHSRGRTMISQNLSS